MIKTRIFMYILGELMPQMQEFNKTVQERGWF
jgi:hypothetical protein